MFCFLSEVQYQEVEHFKNALQNITTDQTPHSVCNLNYCFPSWIVAYM